MLHLEIPHNIDEQQSTETSSFNEKYDPKLHVGVHITSMRDYSTGWVDSRIVPPSDTSACTAVRSLAFTSLVDMGMSSALRTHSHFRLVSGTDKSGCMVAPGSSPSGMHTSIKTPYCPRPLTLFQIPLAGDIRPYLTVQDGDHSSLVNKLPPKAGLLLGVTNPFFEKSCAHWPNTLSLGRRTLYAPPALFSSRLTT